MNPAQAPGDPAALPEQVLPLLLATPCPVAVFDPQDQLRWANPAFRELFGLAPPDSAPDGELRFRNPGHPAGKAPALAPAVTSSL